jgi:hypothetical protein
MISISPPLPPHEKSDEEPPAQAQEETLSTAFEPSGIYYDGPSGKYLVDSGPYFRTYGRKSPVMTGVERHFRRIGMDAKEASTEARDTIRDAEVDRHVEWSGNLAGHRKGITHSADGKPMLILTSPAIPIPSPGSFATIAGILAQAFPDETQAAVFTGWTAGAFAAVAAGVHHPAPLLCLAGPVNSGKTLLASIVRMLLGGRAANPHNKWSGGLPWNDDLVSAELLLLDDCSGSTDPRARGNLAAAFKEAIYAPFVQLMKRHASGLSVRPVWRCMICCNDQPENLLILPPITPDTSDKISILRVSRITPPVDTSKPDGRERLQRMIEMELPAFAHYLAGFVIPEHLRNSRSGICAWRHPELELALEATRPEAWLAELLETALVCRLWDDLPAVMTSSTIETRLTDKDSPVRDAAKGLFYWPAAAGTYLGRLADGGSEIIQNAEFDGHLKVRRFWVRRP